MKKTNLKIEADFEFLTRAKRLIILILPVNFSVGLMTKKLHNSSERCALEATKFLMDTNALYYSHFYFLLPKFLKFVFNFGAINFSKKFTAIFHNFQFSNNFPLCFLFSYSII